MRHIILMIGSAVTLLWVVIVLMAIHVTTLVRPSVTYNVVQVVFIVLTIIAWIGYRKDFKSAFKIENEKMEEEE